MEIILSKQCESLTGTLGRGFGYYIKAHLSHRSGKVRYFSQRSKHTVPPGGHWKMICACANLAEMKLHVSDIKVGRDELIDALCEAKLITPAYCLGVYSEDYPEVFNAEKILKLKKDFNL